MNINKNARLQDTRSTW